MNVPLLIRKPILLKPSAPAASHQLSYNTFITQKLQQQSVLQNQIKYQQKIQQISAIVHLKDEQMQQEKQNFLKNIFKLSLQIDHQKQIIAKYDIQLRKIQTNRNQLQAYYQMKLQQTVSNLIQQFQNRLNAEKQQTEKDLQKIRQNYVSKIGLMLQSGKEREFQVNQRDEKNNNYQIRINILEARLQQRQRTLESQSQKLLLYEMKNKENSSQLLEITKTLKQKQFQYSSTNEILISEKKHSSLLKQQLNNQLLSMKKQLQQQQQQKRQIKKAYRSLQDELETMTRRFLKLEKDYCQILNEMNRKTQKNKEQGSGMTRKMDNGRQTEKQRDNERQKYKQNFNILNQEIQDLNEQKQKLILMIQNKDQRIKELQSQYQNLKTQKQIKTEQVVNNKQIQQLQSLYNDLRNQLEQSQIEKNNIRAQNKKLQTQIKQLCTELSNQAEQYARKIDFMTQKVKDISETKNQQMKHIEQLNQRIHGEYINQIIAQKKKVMDHQMTLNQMNELMMREAQQKSEMKAQLEQLRDKKKKKK